MTREDALKIAKPILFNTEMVRAILDGKKTATRRIMKPQPILEGRFWRVGGAGWSDDILAVHPISCHSLYNKMPYHTGGVMYVREAFCPNYFDESIAGYRTDMRGNRNAYKADYYKEVVCDVVPEPKWCPSIHMPKSAARIFLRVTDVRLERLQMVNEEQAEKEGCFGYRTKGKFVVSPTLHFMETWESTIKKGDIGRYGWKANPWVWVIEFEVLEVKGKFEK